MVLANPPKIFLFVHCNPAGYLMSSPSYDDRYDDIPSKVTCISDRFNASDADVTIKSSDGVLFSVHRKNMETHTGAFPGPEFETGGEIVVLEETAATLELLFSFVYPSRHPSLADTTFEVLAPLAEAAEKYEVFSAMNICHIRMINFVPQHAGEIMSYAAKHGYKELVDEAAPLAVSKPIGDVVRLLPQYLVVPWVIYREQWNEILCGELKHLASSYSISCIPCNRHTPGEVTKPIIKELTLKNLPNFTSITAKNDRGCSRCEVELRSWGQEVERKISELQKFSAFF